MKNRKPNKSPAALFLTLAGGFLSCFPGGPAGAAPPLLEARAASGAASCRRAVLSLDFKESLRRLAETAESMFQEARLGGVYFIGENDLKASAPVYNPVFAPPTAAAERLFNPLYYETLFELLAPVFHLSRSGVIIADTLAQAHKVRKILSGKLPDREFLIYSSFLPPQRKQEARTKAAEGRAYVIVRKDQALELDFSSVPIYISLARAAETNRLQEARDFLDSYKGRRPSHLFFLSAAKNAAPNKEIARHLRQTSVNADLRAKNSRRAPLKPKMTVEESLAHIQAWGFESGNQLKQWLQSFLRPARLTPLSFEDLTGLLYLHSLWLKESGGSRQASSPPQKKEDRPALPSRVRPRYIKFRYDELSEGEKAQIEGLIEGAAGLNFSWRDREILKLRIFSSKRRGLREVEQRLQRSAALISKREDKLLEIFQTSVLIPAELRERIRALTNLKRVKGSWLGYSGFSDAEKAQAGQWAEEVRSRLKLTERQNLLMDHYIFTDSPRSQNEMAAQFNLKDYHSFQGAHDRFLRQLSENEAVPSGLRELIKSRRPAWTKNENSFFRFKDCSPEEKKLIALFLLKFKNQFDFTEREIYLMDNYIFTDRQMSLRNIGEALGGIDSSAILRQSRRILRNIMASNFIPFEFKELLSRRSLPPRKRKRFRYSDLPEEQKPQVDEMAAAAKARLQLDEASAYIFDNMFTDAPETEQSIEQRFGLKPRSVDLRKGSLLNLLKNSGDVPAGLRDLIQNGGAFQASSGKTAQNP